MTVISDHIENVGGEPAVNEIVFTLAAIRGNDSAVVETRQYKVNLTAGNFTTADMDPGPARVKIGPRTYDIVIPNSPTVERLWPLIDAGLPELDADARHVINGGGAAIVRVVDQATWTAIAPGALNTIYIVKPS